MTDEFILAIQNKRMVRVMFWSKEDNAVLVRMCAPMDFGPSRTAKDKSDRFHLWDYESDRKNHVLSLLPSQVQKIEVTDDLFDPKDFVTWSLTKYPWFVSRDWGAYS